jgi:hypothetical protein
MWHQLKNRLGQYPSKPHTVEELEKRINIEWYKFTKEDCLKYIDSMPGRIEAVGGHTDTRNCCTITRTGSGLVDDLRYLLMGIFLAAVMFSGYVYPFKWLFPIFKTARNIWNAGDILYNHILLHPVIH